MKSEQKSKGPGILQKGWFKYITVASNTDNQEFELNGEFDTENMRLTKSEMTSQDEVGNINIPDKYSFQMVLTTSTLNILTSRRNQITRTIDVLDLRGLTAITRSLNKQNDLTYQGGVEVLGNFDEGKCFKLEMRSGKSQIICSTNEGKVLDMVSYIQEIVKARKSKNTDQEKDADHDSNFSVDDKNFNMEEQVKEELDGRKHKQNQIDIGDWSVCDHVCGGGVQSKSKGCVPPIGGFKCEKQILKRSCNTEPCKEGENPKKIEGEDDWKHKQATITLPIKLESRQVSHRFQQYEECRIKDEDLCIRRQDLVLKLGLKQAPVLPGRGVLNKTTFSYQENTKQDSLHRSFLLQDIVIKPFALDTNCFEVKSKQDAKDTLVLCGCPFEPSSQDAALNWTKDIVKFRDNCARTDRHSINVDDKSTLSLKQGNETINVSGAKLKDLAKDSLNDKMHSQEQEDDEKEQTKMSDAINQVESLTTNQTKNEFFKERILEKEEELKAKKELQNMDKLIQKEKEKEKCIQTFLQREARRQKRKTSEKQAEEELHEIKSEVQRQVMNIKHVFRSKMSRLRQETDRAKMNKMKQLTNMKLRITSMLIDQEIKGSISNCKQDKEESKVAYCNARYNSTWFENKYCRVKENFCGVCCEKEFNVKFADDREKCLYECRLVNGMISTAPSAVSKSSSGGSNETATVEIINNP